MSNPLDQIKLLRQQKQASLQRESQYELDQKRRQELIRQRSLSSSLPTYSIPKQLPITRKPKPKPNPTNKPNPPTKKPITNFNVQEFISDLRPQKPKSNRQRNDVNKHLISTVTAPANSIKHRIASKVTAEPLIKVGQNKRDLRSVDEIQRDLNEKLGKVVERKVTGGYDRSKDPRVMQTKVEEIETKPPLIKLQRADDRNRMERGQKRQMPTNSQKNTKGRQFEQKTSSSSPTINRKTYSNKQPSKQPPPSSSPPARRKRSHTNTDVIDEEYAQQNYSSIISQMFGYNRNKYADEFDVSDMEATADDILKEERKSAKLARIEDEREERLELERKKKRKV